MLGSKNLENYSDRIINKSGYFAGVTISNINIIGSYFLLYNQKYFIIFQPNKLRLLR